MDNNFKKRVYCFKDMILPSLVSSLQRHKAAVYGSSNWNWAAIFDDLSGSKAGGYGGLGGGGARQLFPISN